MTEGRHGGLVSCLPLGEVRLQHCFSLLPLASSLRPVTQRPSPFLEMQTESGGQDPVLKRPAASALPTFCLGPGICVGGARSGALPLTVEPERQPRSAVPGLEPLGLGEGPGSRFVLSPAFALHKQLSSPRGDLVPQPRKAKLLI